MLAARIRLSARQTGTKLILLGTGGGPRPRKASSGSAHVIVSSGVAYVIDCGDGVARQLAFAGVPFPSVRHIFITHQHSDHTADYGNLILLAWTAGLSSRVDTWGPPPLARMTQLFFEMNASDIDIRVANEGRTPLAPLVHVHELREGGAVTADGNVTVTAALVDHPPVVPAFAYRFDARDARSSSPATRRRRETCEARQRRGRPGPFGDVSASDRPPGRPIPNAARLKTSILAHQTSAEDAGRIAQEAGVKTLVLSHFVPPDNPEVTDAMWRDAASRHFRGTVIVGHDPGDLSESLRGN